MNNSNNAYSAINRYEKKCKAYERVVSQAPTPFSFVTLAICYEELGLQYYNNEDYIHAQACFLKSFIICKSLFENEEQQRLSDQVGAMVFTK